MSYTSRTDVPITGSTDEFEGAAARRANRTTCPLVGRRAVNLSVPVRGKTLALGTWQGIYLWEHRRQGHRRELMLHVLGEP